MSIFLTIMIAIPCVIILVIRFVIVPHLCLPIWWPHGFGSTFKSFMSILLIVATISFKSFCVHGLGSAFMCSMTFLVALLVVKHVLRLDILICSLAPTHISSMSFLTTIMTCRFRVLTFYFLLSSTFLDDSTSSVLVCPSQHVSLLGLGDLNNCSNYLMD